jgi:acyl carrier protein
MMPAAFVRLPSLPLTPNGKVDRKALPKPGVNDLPLVAASMVPPRSETERKLATLWSELLHVDSSHIGVDHDFFDLGGHSLRAMQVLARVRGLFGAAIGPIRFFDEPTIAGLARLIEESRTTAAATDAGAPSSPAILPRAGRR